jgi:hypothetical protein
MKSYLIGYDLNKSGQDYGSLIEQIKGLGTWWHCLDSTWIVKSVLTAVEIRDKLKSYIDNNDELLVAKLSDEAAWIGFNTDCSQWLKDNL